MYTLVLTFDGFCCVGTQRLPRLVGLAKATEMMLVSSTLDLLSLNFKNMFMNVSWLALNHSKCPPQ